MKILSCLKTILNLFNTKNNKDNINTSSLSTPQLIPNEFHNDEIINRFIYAPINIDSKKNSLKTNAFTPPFNSQELSVNRHNYSTVSEMKKIAKKGSNPESSRSFHGFGILTVNQILSTTSQIIYTPILEPSNNRNIFHSDILLGYTLIRGEEKPPELTKKIKDLTKSCKLFIDPNPESDECDIQIDI